MGRQAAWRLAPRCSVTGGCDVSEFGLQELKHVRGAGLELYDFLSIEARKPDVLQEIDYSLTLTAPRLLVVPFVGQSP